MKQEQGHQQGPHKNIYYLDFGKKEAGSALQNSSASSQYQTIEHYIAEYKPDLPVYCIRPDNLKNAAQWFLGNFKHYRHESHVLYSVKSNPDSAVLQHLYDAGIRRFDVASLVEIQTIFDAFGSSATMHFMHTIKSRKAIKEAYFNFGIRDFALDSLDELKKILEETDHAKDLTLHIRLAIPNNHSALDLSGKFGVLPNESKTLFRKARAVAHKLGVCFHVGSQCMEPMEFRNAINIAKKAVDKARVKLDILDVGGGFPSSYPGMIPVDLSSYLDEILDAVTQINLDKDCQLWCEPGRALVAESASLLVRVESRKKNMLYINDGTYGGLFDAGFPGFLYHVKALRVNHKKSFSKKQEAFGFYGPTCDALDTMKGPFYLPKNIAEGDYIEIGQLGAYSRSLRTDFNGFSDDLQIEVSDPPLFSMYRDNQEEQDVLLAS